MADLSESELDNVTFAFTLYDANGTGFVDGASLGDLLRACGLNPTDALIGKVGGTKKAGEKQISLEEFIPIYSQTKKDKDQGVFEDFIECLKLYDKQEDGTMLCGELLHILLTLGEKLTEDQLDEVTKECLDPEDEDGFIQYVPFMARVCGRPVPDNPNPFCL